MAYKLYDGTSAYRIDEIDEYLDYNEKAQQKQEEQLRQSKKRSLVNIKKLALIMAIVFVVGGSFVWINAALLQSSAELTELTAELERTEAYNAQVAFEIVSDVDLDKVEEKAVSSFGMQRPESYQNVYVDVVQSDYANVKTASADNAGFIDGMIKSLKSFLAYIG